MTPAQIAFSKQDCEFVNDYLPQHPPADHVHVTLTFATSLDSAIAARHGVQTVLSGPKSKAMTHYLRSRHDGILIGVGTALADDPGLNCRLEGAGGYGGVGTVMQPRPLILDPSARWRIGMDAKVMQLAAAGCGKAPFVLVGRKASQRDQDVLSRYGGKYIVINDNNGVFDWHDVVACLQAEGISSVMIEGGGKIINSLLRGPGGDVVDSVITTIAPVWLGQGGVVVSPSSTGGSSHGIIRLADIVWRQLGEDVVMCGRVIH